MLTAFLRVVIINKEDFLVFVKLDFSINSNKKLTFNWSFK